MSVKYIVLAPHIDPSTYLQFYPAPQNTESPILPKQGHSIRVMANISAKLLQDVTKEVLSNFAMCSFISPAISAHNRLL